MRFYGWALALGLLRPNSPVSMHCFLARGDYCNLKPLLRYRPAKMHHHGLLAHGLVSTMLLSLYILGAKLHLI